MLVMAIPAQAQTYTVTANRGEVSETYQGNMDTGELMISWGTEAKVIADIVGYAVQSSRALVSFNGAPALTYENAGSNTHFKVFYTLALEGKAPVIDCVYGNIRNGQNGASIGKAVCNLDKPLSSEYQDLIFAYSDKWIEASNAVSLQSVMAEPSQAAGGPENHSDCGWQPPETYRMIADVSATENLPSVSLKLEAAQVEGVPAFEKAESEFKQILQSFRPLPGVAAQIKAASKP